MGSFRFRLSFFSNISCSALSSPAMSAGWPLALRAEEETRLEVGVVEDDEEEVGAVSVLPRAWVVTVRNRTPAETPPPAPVLLGDEGGDMRGRPLPTADAAEILGGGMGERLARRALESCCMCGLVAPPLLLPAPTEVAARRAAAAAADFLAASSFSSGLDGGVIWGLGGWFEEAVAEAEGVTARVEVEDA